MSDICDRIIVLHRERRFAMRQRLRTTNALAAFLRTVEGWRRELPKSESDAIKKKVLAAIKAGESKAKGAVPLDPLYLQWEKLIDATLASRLPFDQVEAGAVAQMEKLAAQLPVWQNWGKDCKGFGARSLATIIGEAGDLDDYPSPAHLWKRFGLAVINGLRQGGLPKSAKADDWIEHGYSGNRRAVLWVIGETIIQHKGPFREAYDVIKQRELAKAAARGQIVEPASKRTKQQPDLYMSVGHVHARAKRAMEKQLLRDLWQAWRQEQNKESEAA